MADSVYDVVGRWLFREAMPFWAQNGIDRRYGGYVEQLRVDGSDPAVDFKRVRVIGRQIYVFSHAALLGRNDGIELARHGFTFLTKNAWLGDDRGWASVLDRKGSVRDKNPDLYDLAFVLLALGWYYRVTADPSALDWAIRTHDFVDRHMRHSSGRGFVTDGAPRGARLQNPHMHLLEATLVNLDTTGDARFRVLADELVGLFCDHLYDRETRTLGELFDDDWSRMPGEAGCRIEPGHQFEWAWILAGYQRTTGHDMREFIRGLVDFAEAYGVDPKNGVTYNAVRNDGSVLDGGSRVWPNTERLQAAVAMFELDGRDPRPVLEQSTRLLLERHLAHIPRGTWVDAFAADGSPQVDKVPASTLYHLFIAFAEVLRVEAAVRRAFPE